MKIILSPESAKKLVTKKCDPDSINNFDADLVNELIEPIKAFGKFYFRYTVEGLEKIPEGPAMIVGNHNAGITFLEPFFFVAEWYTKTGGADPIYPLTHDAMLAIPLVKNLLMMGGAMRASYESSDTILSNGRKLLVFPGGNYEAFRTFKDRFKVDFGGHKGFTKVSLKHNVPIVPLASIGGQETFIVLSKGEKLAKLLHTDKLFRSKTCAVSLALPWGILVGPFFHLPLPAKTEIEVCDPIYPEEVCKGLNTMEEKIDALYNAVTGALQEKLTAASYRRKLPLVG